MLRAVDGALSTLRSFVSVVGIYSDVTKQQISTFITVTICLLAAPRLASVDMAILHDCEI